MSRTALFRSLPVSLAALALVVSGAAVGAPSPLGVALNPCGATSASAVTAECSGRATVRPAEPDATTGAAVSAGNVFVDGTPIVDGNASKLTFPPMDMSAPQVVAAEVGGSQILGYDFTPDGATLYGVNEPSSALITVDQSSGVEHLVGPMTKGVGDVWVDLTIDPVTGAAYASSANDLSYSLYSLDLASGATTLIKTVATTVVPLDMSMSCAGQLYAETGVDDSLYRVNPADGALTLVGPLGFDLNNAQGMDFDNATGVLHAWLLSANPGYVSTYASINTTTGAATAFPGTSPFGEFEGAVKTGCGAPVAITSGPSGKTADLRPAFGFTAAERTTVQCSIDTGTPVYGPCGGAAFRPAADLAPGGWTFRMLGTRGAATGQASRAFTVVDCAGLKANVAKAKKLLRKAKKGLKRATRTGDRHGIAKARKKVRRAKVALKKARAALAAEPVCG